MNYDAMHRDDLVAKIEALARQLGETYASEHEATACARESAEALRIAQRVLRRWAELYADWSQHNGQMERLMDHRLPPADHIWALEDIDAALAKNPSPVVQHAAEPSSDANPDAAHSVNGRAGSQPGELTVRLLPLLKDEVLAREIAMAIRPYEPISAENCAAMLADIREGIDSYIQDHDVDPASYVPQMKSHPDLAGLAAALRAQRQIDEDGTEVGVSRQAADEAAAIIEALGERHQVKSQET